MAEARRIAMAAVLVAALSGCANPINQRTATNYYQAAVDAEVAGDYRLAERNYERALVNARLGHSPDAGISAAMYGLGRMKGRACRYDEAEKLLLESLRLEETVTGPKSATTTMRLFEIARLYYDQGKYVASLPYFRRGMMGVKTLGVQRTDPIALADALDDYATALANAQQPSDADAVRREASDLRQRNPGAKAIFKPVRYNQKCAT
ncbi:MAG: tetratricopeptide repeat protein [Burkholderiales bacterium]